MPAKITKAPVTAAEARALADQLSAEERERTQRMAAAAKTAEVATCRQQLDQPANEISTAATDANDAWISAVHDTTVGVDQLWNLWQAKRLTAAARAGHVATASAALDQRVPRYDGLPHRMDTHDYTAGTSFIAALDDVIEQRARDAHNAAARAVQDAMVTAGHDAATQAAEG